eukprot:1082903-Pleurochrysis_carterae.AAC.1
MGELAKVRIRTHSDVEGRRGVKVRRVRGRLPPLIDKHFNSAVEGERLRRLSPAQGLDEVRRTTRALHQSGGKANAEGVPAVTRRLIRG